MRIFLIGLRRSGTTTLFDLFRQDKRLVCYDEPFNPLIRDIPARDEWGTKQEYIDLYNRSPAAFWDRYAYIDGVDEIRPGMEPRQRAWLRTLLDSAPSTFMDFTRVHYKLADLHAACPDALLIHLHRSPAAFAASHILPSPWQADRKLKYWRARLAFWRITQKYNTWGLETVIGRAPTTFCGEALARAGLDAGRIYAANAVTKLLAFWLLNFRQARADGTALFGNRYVQIPFEQFTRAPQAYMNWIYARLGMAPADFDFSKIRQAPPPPFATHPGWDKAASVAGLDPRAWRHDGDLVLENADPALPLLETCGRAA